MIQSKAIVLNKSTLSKVSMVKKLAVILSAFFFLSLFSTRAYACSPSMGDEWFNLEYTFDEKTFPEGFSIEFSGEDYKVENNSNDSIYIVRRKEYFHKTELYTELGIELPEDYVVKYRIDPQAIYYAMHYNSEAPYHWEENEDGNRINRTSLEDYTFELKGDSLQVYEDGRPDNVEIPDDQKFSLYLYKDEEIVDAKGSIRYSLNEDYDPEQRANSVKWCDQLNNEVNNSTEEVELATLSELGKGIIFAPVLIVIIVITF